MPSAATMTDGTWGGATKTSSGREPPPFQLSPEAHMTSSVPTVGQEAPDFALLATPDRQLSLRDLRGHRVVLAFYPADWSPVCGDELALLNQALPLVRRRGAELVAISVDGVWCHAAFAAARNLHFPLLADFEPKGAVARAYGVYGTEDGTSDRAFFVLDEAGVVAWREVVAPDVNPGVDGVLEALDRMQKPSDPAAMLAEAT
jgi:peroxiredoxin